MKSWVDGRPGGAIDCRDRGFNYGDGVFETMLVRRHSIRLLDYHLERLTEGCRRLSIAAPDAARLRRELVRIAAIRRHAVMKLILTRGRGARGYRPSGHERCTRVIYLFSPPTSASSQAPSPARVRMCATRLGSNAALAGLKTLNRLESVLARTEWTDAAVWEGLMRDTDDNIIGGTMSNCFIRQGSALITPKLDRCGIAGVMRRWVLEQAASMKLRAREVRLRWSDLAAADEAFMTNAVVGIVPLAEVQQGRSRIRFSERDASAELNRRLRAL